jgi:hypothetical protein
MLYARDKHIKVLQNNISRRAISLAPCGIGHGEGSLALRSVAGSSRQIFHEFVMLYTIKI